MRGMNRSRQISRSAAAGLGTVMLILAASTRSAEELPRTSPDGLELVERTRQDEGVAIVYVRPGATLAAYQRVLLDPAQVAFDKSWVSQNPRVSASDRERIRRELAEEFRVIFSEELESKGGYAIAQTAGPDVLRVTAAIADLYIQAPGVATPTHSTKYTVPTSRMSLIAELRDAESGAILARVADRRIAAAAGGMPGALHWTTRAANRAEARRILRTWAELLRRALDSAREAAP